jgi:biotin carboxyl carrier protein
MVYDISLGGKTYRLEITRSSDAPFNFGSTPHRKVTDRWACRLDGRQIPVDAVQLSPDVLSLVVNGESFEVRNERAGEGQRLFIGGIRYEVSVEDPRSLRSRMRVGLADAGPQRLTASMPGTVVRVLAREGDKISARQGIIVVEAMKMQNEIRSPKEGVLKRILAQDGEKVNAGDVLAIVE